MQSQSAKPFDSIRIAQISDEGMTGASVSMVLKLDHFAPEPERRVERRAILGRFNDHRACRLPIRLSRRASDSTCPNAADARRAGSGAATDSAGSRQGADVRTGATSIF
jgi:hypothetical protein